jgi:hypothetical protein
VIPNLSSEVGDDTWKESDSLNADDLLPLAELLREAYAWIRNQKRADAKGLRHQRQQALVLRASVTSPA